MVPTPTATAPKAIPAVDDLAFTAPGANTASASTGGDGAATERAVHARGINPVVPTVYAESGVCVRVCVRVCVSVCVCVRVCAYVCV